MLAQVQDLQCRVFAYSFSPGVLIADDGIRTRCRHWGSGDRFDDQRTASWLRTSLTSDGALRRRKSCWRALEGPHFLQHLLLVSCLIYSRALLEYVIFITWVRSVIKMLMSVKFAEDKVLTFLILRRISVKNAKIVQLLSLTQILTLIFRADWSNKSEWYYRYLSLLLLLKLLLLLS